MKTQLRRLINAVFVAAIAPIVGIALQYAVERYNDSQVHLLYWTDFAENPLDEAKDWAERRAKALAEEDVARAVDNAKRSLWYRVPNTNALQEFRESQAAFHRDYIIKRESNTIKTPYERLTVHCKNMSRDVLADVIVSFRGFADYQGYTYEASLSGSEAQTFKDNVRLSDTRKEAIFRFAQLRPGAECSVTLNALQARIADYSVEALRSNGKPASMMEADYSRFLWYRDQRQSAIHSRLLYFLTGCVAVMGVFVAYLWKGRHTRGGNT